MGPLTQPEALEAAGQDADANAGQGNVGDPVTTCTWQVSLILTVVRNATQTNVVVPEVWATVKSASEEVVVEAITSPNTEAYWHAIDWSGDAGVPGDKPNQRKLSRATSGKLTIEAQLGGSKDSLDIWVIWADLEIKIGHQDEIDIGNDATIMVDKHIWQDDHTWPGTIGGGNKLGTWNSHGASGSYAYTVGKMQAKATLTPDGIEDVIDRKAWRMRRTRTFVAFDDAHKSTDPYTDYPDPSGSDYMDLDPKSGSSVREIYDLDGPGCSAIWGPAIMHTAETYANFKQWAAVVLDQELVCSDVKLWSYQARVDVDKDDNEVELNEMHLIHIPIPTDPHYPKR